jgi:hypothetical protein
MARAVQIDRVNCTIIGFHLLAELWFVGLRGSALLLARLRLLNRLRSLSLQYPFRVLALRIPVGLLRRSRWICRDFWAARPY